MLEAPVQCPACKTPFKIALPELMVGGGKKVLYRCDNCNCTSKTPGDCDTCGGKSWGLA